MEIDTSDLQRSVMTVTGPVAPGELGITDAHNHLWIEPVGGIGENLPYLTQYDLQQQEIRAYRLAGGNAQIDCQPGFAGRNGNRLAALSESTGVKVVACTGYHLRKYYPSDAWLWQSSAERAKEYFCSEINDSLVETKETPRPVRAGFIKIACEARMEANPQHLMEAAAATANETGAALEIHTEKGADAEGVFDFFLKHGVSPWRIILCHMDKRADFGLHQELAKSGAGLEYDTFYRSKYRPEENAWPLIGKMVAAGLASAIMLATDIAEPNLWPAAGGPGLTGLITQVRQRLVDLKLNDTIIQMLLGGNIANRLAFPR